MATSEAIVTAGPPAIAPLGIIPIAAVEGQPLNNVVVASFTDANTFDTAATFSRQVTWGDAATPYAATVLKTAFNDYDVLASRTYAEDTPVGAPFPITVTIGKYGGRPAGDHQLGDGLRCAARIDRRGRASPRWSTSP